MTQDKKILSLEIQIKSLEDQVGKDLERLHKLRNKLNFEKIQINKMEDIPNTLKIELQKCFEDIRKESQRELLSLFVLNQDSLEKIKSLIETKVKELSNK